MEGRADVADRVLALCIDRSVYYFGSAVEFDMEEAEERANPNDAKTRARIAKARAARQGVLSAYLGQPEQKRYAEPNVDRSVLEETTWKPKG